MCCIVFADTETLILSFPRDVKGIVYLKLKMTPSLTHPQVYRFGFRFEYMTEFKFLVNHLLCDVTPYVTSQEFV